MAGKKDTIAHIQEKKNFPGRTNAGLTTQRLPIEYSGRTKANQESLISPENINMEIECVKRTK